MVSGWGCVVQTEASKGNLVPSRRRRGGFLRGPHLKIRNCYLKQGYTKEIGLKINAEQGITSSRKQAKERVNVLSIKPEPSYL